MEGNENVRNFPQFIERLHSSFARSKKSHYGALLLAFANHYLPFWFTSTFSDNGDLSKALISFFLKNGNIKMSTVFETLRKVRNVIEHDKFLSKKLVLELISSLDYICNEYKSHQELYSKSFEFLVIIGQTGKESHVDIPISISIHSSQKDEFQNKKDALYDPVPVSVPLSEEDRPSVATFNQLKSSSFKTKLKGVTMTLLDGKFTGKKGTFFKWNGNNCYVNLEDGGLTRFNLQRKVHIDWKDD